MDLFDEKITEIEDIEKKKVLVSNVYDEQNHVVSGLLTKSQCTQKAVYGIGMSVLCVQQTERCRHRTIILSSTSRLSSEGRAVVYLFIYLPIISRVKIF